MMRFFILLFLIFSFFFTSSGQEQETNATGTNESFNTGIEAVDTLFRYSDTSSIPAKVTKSPAAILTQVINKAQQYAFELSELKLELAEYMDTLDMSEELPKIHPIADSIKSKTEADSQYYHKA